MHLRFHTNAGKFIFYLTNTAGLSLIVCAVINLKSLTPMFAAIAFLYLLANLFPVKVYKKSSFVWTSIIVVFAVFHLSLWQMILLSLLAAIQPAVLQEGHRHEVFSNTSVLAICYAASKLVFIYLNSEVPIYKNIFASIPLITALIFTLIVLYFFWVSASSYLVDGKDRLEILKFVYENILFELALIHLGFLSVIIYYYQPFALLLPVFPVFAIYATTSIRLKFIENKKAVSRDNLTGLLNKQIFNEQLTIELAQSAREKSQLSVLLVDLDNFGLFNETFGHPEGDIALKKIANVLESTARESDICCRYEGGKFAIILPGTPMQGAAYVAERIRRFVELEHIGKPTMQLTVSIGIAGYPFDCKNEKELIEVSSNNLAIAKSEGKNSIRGRCFI